MKLSSDSKIPRREQGSATIIFTILLGIMMILVAAEMQSLSRLHSSSRWLEKQQIKRLNQISAQPPTPSPSK